ncbi:coiled-coil domain-containing protein 40 [Cebidichthys violaceus]|uniref:coiled-coil domain-containing protein 40 n=1 Tax=Cebidichthys violaceus TaxID=271503 RepID=UPI0035C96D48
MQSAEGEGGREEGRGGSSRQTEEGNESDGAAEDCAQETQPGPEAEDPSLQPHPDHSGADDYSPASTNSVQGNAAQAPLTLHPSNLNISEDMDDRESLPEDEEEEREDHELIVLDPEHPLVKRHQAALNIQLRKQLERINLELSTKRAMVKADAKHQLELGVETFRVQEKLARLRTRLDDRHHAKAQAEAKHRQTQDQLEAMKSQHSRITSQNDKAKANVSQLQAKTNDLMLQLTFTQGVSQDLRSNIKATKNARGKARAEKNQAEEQKLKQDLYVERLTKEKERQTQQIALYEAQAKAQAEETQAAKEAHSEAEMEMESLVMGRKQLLQQWSSSLVGMRKRDEAFSAMQEAVRTVEHQVILMDREIEDYKRSITEEQERSETLTQQLKGSQADGATSKRLISQKQAQQEALQAQYSTCLRTLRETELTLARLSKDIGAHQVEVNDQRRQLEKESALRLESEEKIMTHIQQELTHNNAAKYSQRLTGRIAALKKQKLSQLWQLENDVVSVGLQSSEVSQHVDGLTLTQEGLDEEIAKYNESLTTNQAKISSFATLIGQKQATISKYNRKIHQIADRTGNEDLSPLQIKMAALTTQIEELSANIKSDQQLWMKRQRTLVGLSQEIEANSRDMLKLQIEYTTMQQKKICLESQITVEHRESAELDKNVKILKGDLLKLKTLLSKNRELSQALQQQHALMEADGLHRLKEAEREAIKMRVKHENTQEEKERLLNVLVEAKRQIMLWEKKTHLIKETRSAVDGVEHQGHVQMMKAEIHRMEVRLNQLMKQQERLLRESEATVERRETIVLRSEAIAHHSAHRRQTSKGELSRITQRLQRKIRDTQKHVEEREQVIGELQKSQESLSNRLAQQRQQLIELCGTSSILDPEFGNLQDTKDRNLVHLVALQSRAKKLQGVCEGSYKASSTSGSVAGALQSQMERVHAVNTVVHRVCEEFPRHQGALRRLSQALEARTQEP